MKYKLILYTTVILAFLSCSKKTADTAPAIVPERLEISPVSNGINTGEVFQYSLKFFNNTGQQSTTPASIVWTSTNNAIATVNQAGLATAVGPGQAEIKATYNNISATALLTVVTNSNQLATVTLSPATTAELKLNQNITLTAVGKNSAGGIINGLSFTWQSDNVSFAQVNNTGLVTAAGYGTANIVATASGIQSAPVMVQVIRSGDFSGSNSIGTAKLKIENNILKLQTSSNFFVQTGPPDLRIYLGNNNTNITGALEVASLTQRSGTQSWNIALPTTITQYKYAIVWCKQFGGTYGVADLGN